MLLDLPRPDAVYVVNSPDDLLLRVRLLLRALRYAVHAPLLPAVQQRCWDTLSMGMTDDLEHAIAAGATHIRIGTALFGARE